MELLKSNKFKLPTLFFISDRNDIQKLPIGTPFIYGDEQNKPNIIRLLEYEVLYRKAKATGLPFNFKMILENNGFDDLTFFDHCDSVYMDYVTEDNYNIDGSDFDIDKLTPDSISFNEYVKDCTAIVDINVLKNLKIFPTWLDNIELALSTNIHNFITYNDYMYNKKLDGMYGGLELRSPNRNLLVIDISRSIPKAIGTTLMTLSKWMGETFYCDILITGKSTLFVPYEEIYLMNIDEIYSKYGNSQECSEFRKIITTDIKNYDTCIVFGDHHSVCDDWCSGSKRISREDGQKLCKWNINKLLCFHTTSNYYVPGFADWFSPNEIEHIENWVEYLEK